MSPRPPAAPRAASARRHPPHAPPAASARRYLRGSLPAVYSEGPRGRPLPVMGLLEGLEQVLDPLVALLDNLPLHLEPATAPAELVDFLTELAGAPLDRTLPLAARRRLLAAAAPIAAARGTRAGLELALRCAFPELEPEVVDHGAVRASDAAAPADLAPPAVSFEVLLADDPSPRQAAQLARCVADHRPAGAAYRVRRRDAGGG
jgi:phage tail-like protein